MSRRVCGSVFVVLLIAVAALAAAPSLRVKVLDRVRLSVYTEDITYVTSGPYKGQIVILDGYHVLGMKEGGGGKADAKNLFDLVNFPAMPNGIAYVESLKLFAITSGQTIDKLYFVDQSGKLLYTRDIQFLSGILPWHSEGLEYIPSTSAMYPDRLILATIQTSAWDYGRLQIMDLDGIVVREIVLPPILDFTPVGAVTILPPDRILVQAYGRDDIQTLDFSGNLLQTIPCPDCFTIGGFEGLTNTKSGLIVGAGVGGDLLFFDGYLNRLPDQDLVWAPNLGLDNRLRGIAWDSNAGRFLVYQWPFPLFEIVSVPPSLDGYSLQASLNDLYRNATGLTYLPDENHFAVAAARRTQGNPPVQILPPSILVFEMDAGVASVPEIIDLTGLGLGNPNSVTYIPSTHQFAVKFGGNPTKLFILSRTGAYVREIDFATKTSGLAGCGPPAFFNPNHPSGGQFLFTTGPDRRMLVTDFYGNVLGEFNQYTELGLLTGGPVIAITSGPRAGAFAMYGDTGEMVVFSVK